MSEPDEIKPRLSNLVSLWPQLAQGNGAWMLSGVALALATALASIALLAVSGGFLTASALAGMTAATAFSFNYFAPAATIRFLAIARTLGRWSERVLTHEATFRLLASLRVWLYRRIAQLSPRQLGRHHSGDLLNHLTRDIDALDNLYLRFGVPYATAWLLTCLLVALLMYWSTMLALFVLLPGALILLILPTAAWHAGKRSASHLIETRSMLRQRLLDNHDGIEDFYLHDSAWQAQRQQTLKAHQQLLVAQSTQQRWGTLFRAVSTVIGGAAALWILLPAAQLMQTASLPAPWLAALPLLLLGLTEILTPLPSAFLELPGTAQAAGRIRALAAQLPEPAFVSQSGSPANGELQLQEVHYRHDPCQPLIEGLSLSIPAGRHVAISGQSGCGKSTLLSLIARLEDPQGGIISLAGHPLAEFDESSLRQHIALHTQDDWLSATTIADNLRLARPDASDAELWSALDCAGLSSTVASWPQGLRTPLAEGGANLSGGERRRLNLARVLLREAPVTLLDEPAEGLDADAERTLLTAIRTRLAGRTLVWVTHKPETAAAFEHHVRL